MSPEGHGELVKVYWSVFAKFSHALNDRNTSVQDRDCILEEMSILIDIYTYIVFPYTSKSVEGSVVSLMWYVFSCDRLVIRLFH